MYIHTLPTLLDRLTVHVPVVASMDIRYGSRCLPSLFCIHYGGHEIDNHTAMPFPTWIPLSIFDAFSVICSHYFSRLMSSCLFYTYCTLRGALCVWALENHVQRPQGSQPADPVATTYCYRQVVWVRGCLISDQ